MNSKKTLYVVAIILVISLVIYLSAHKNVKCGEICLTTSVKQKASKAAPIVKNHVKVDPIGSKTAKYHPKVTFLELGSVGCMPCNMMAPILDEIEKEYDGQVNVRFYDIRTMLGAPYGEKYKVQFMPTQVFLDKNGVEYYRHVGFFEKAEVVKILKMQGVK
jgi:thioredoxin 1